MSEWNKYDAKPETQYEREQRIKYEDDPATIGRKNVLDIKDEYFEGVEDLRPQLAAESGKFIDGLPWDKFFHAKGMGKKIVAAYRMYLFTKNNVTPISIINIGGEDYELKDYGLENCFSSGVDIVIPWLCIQKKITKSDLQFQLVWEDRAHG